MLDIESIVFCADLSKNNCAIINTSGEIELITREEGIELVSIYMNQKGISSFYTLEKNQKIFYMKKEKFQNLIKTRRTQKQSQNLNISFKHVGIKRVIFSFYFMGLILSGVTLNKEIPTLNKIESSYDLGKQPLETKDEFHNIYELLQDKNINPVKREMFSHVWDYLREYQTKNLEVIYSFNEIKAEYLMYNDLKIEEFKNIFLKDELDLFSLKDEYQDSVSKEILLSSFMTTSTFKEGLIRNRKGYQFYKKYESLIIDFNKEENLEKKTAAC